MPRLTVEINNTALSPWIARAIPDNARSGHINGLRRVARMYNPFRHVDSNYFRDMCLDPFTTGHVVFPPVRRTFDRIWREFICSTHNESFVISHESASNTVIALLAARGRFEMLCNDRRIRQSDIPAYKYCVIVAALNVLHQIFDFYSQCELTHRNRYFPTDYLEIKSSYHNTASSSALGNCYKFSIKPGDFLTLYNLIPEPGPLGNPYAESMNFSFWTELWQLYSQSVHNGPQRITERITARRPQRRSLTPRLMEEYIRREEKKTGFITKEQLIRMINESVLPENVLGAIYDIVTCMEK